MRRTLMAVGVIGLATLVIVACRDKLLSPPADVPTPMTQIMDASHGGHNQDFFFLPPLVPDPSKHPAFDADGFDATQAPVVEVCLVGGGTCAAEQPPGFPLTYTMTSGPASETIRLNATEQHYIVNWHTDQSTLDPSLTYRIRVLVAGAELGYADVDVVSSGRALKNVDTDEYVPLLDGRTLPIKFRIEVGAVFVVGKEGGTVVAENGAVTLTIPARDAPVGITVQPTTTYPANANLIPGTVFDLGPAGATFDPPATLAIRYDPQSVPAGTYPRLHKVVNGVWEPVLGSTADLPVHAVSAPVTGFSTWGIVGTGVVLTVHVTGGVGQVRVTVPAGTPLDPCTYNDVSCTTDFPPGTEVTLVAEGLNIEAVFETWSGTGAGFTCTTDRSCAFTMDQDREVTATFSMPGLVSADPPSVAFSMIHGGAATPASAPVTVRNIGGRPVYLITRTTYSQIVPPWLDDQLSATVVDPSTPVTLTLSVRPNTLPPGLYNAVIRVGDLVETLSPVSVTLTITAGAQYTYDGTGKEFGPLPLSTFILTSTTGADIYPFGAGEFYMFGLFDTGSDIVLVTTADATALNMGSASTSNTRQDTRVRLNGLSAIDAATLNVPLGPHGTSGGAQAEVPDIRVGIRAGNASLIGAPVANAVVALIDNSATVTRGPYPFCGGCYAEGPDITFYMPTDAGVPVPDLQLPLERFGSSAPALLDNATNGQKYFLNDVLFRHGANAVMDDRAAAQPYRFWFDTGAPPTIINVRMANALGIDLSAGGSFDCFTGTGKEGNEGYVIDHIAFVGTASGGVGTYAVDHASVCVDVRDEELRQRYPDPNNPSAGIKLDAVIGANLFMHVPILFDGKNNKLGIMVP